jgi:CBS domain-containing protein
MDPLAFLLQHPPFECLDEAARRLLGAGLDITFVPAGARVLEHGGPRSQHLYVVRRGAIRLERDGQLLQVIEDGECFGFPSLIGRTSPTADAVAAEDTLLYLVPEATFARLMERREFAEFFLVDLSERLRRSAALESLPIGGELATPVGRLSVSPPIFITGGVTIGEAARRMREAGVSSVLVEGDPVGILTDRDLRSRVLAEGRGPDTRVEAVATRPVQTLPARATLFEALVFMLERRVHHAPLEDEGRITGIITDTDLLRLQVKSPLYLLRKIEHLAIPGDLPRYVHELTAMVEALLWGGLDALQIGPVVSRLNDALVVRLLRTVEADLGPPPVPYAWMVFGSEGRMEQTLITDQDNALVYQDDEGSTDAYFPELAGRVVQLLVTASIPACPGGFMATNWRRSLPGWLRLFRGWVETPEPRALLEALNFFDFRPVHGELDLHALEELLLAAGLAGPAAPHRAFPPHPRIRRRRRSQEGWHRADRGARAALCARGAVDRALDAGPARGRLRRRHHEPRGRAHADRGVPLPAGDAPAQPAAADPGGGAAHQPGPARAAVRAGASTAEGRVRSDPPDAGGHGPPPCH